MAGNPLERLKDLDVNALSRRDVLMGAGGVMMAGGLAACGSSSSSSTEAPQSSTAITGTPKAGGNFRLGVTGGGSKDIIDGQSIITKPDQARLMSGWETLLTYDGNYKLTTDGLAEEATQDNATQWTIRLKRGHRVQQRQDARRRRRHLLASSASLNPKNGLFGVGRPRRRSIPTG